MTEVGRSATVDPYNRSHNATRVGFPQYPSGRPIGRARFVGRGLPTAAGAAVSASTDLLPVIDKLSSGLCGEAILVKAQHHSLARRLEDNSSVLQRDWTAVIRDRRWLIADARLVEIVSRREHDPLTVLACSQRIPADRRLGRHLAVFLPHEQIKITSAMVHAVKSLDRRREDFLAIGHHPLYEFVGAGEVGS